MTEEYLRVLAAHFHAMLVMQIAHEPFERNLFELTQQDMERQNRAYAMVRFCYLGISPDSIGKMATDREPSKTTAIQ